MNDFFVLMTLLVGSTLFIPEFVLAELFQICLVCTASSLKLNIRPNSDTDHCDTKTPLRAVIVSRTTSKIV